MNSTPNPWDERYSSDEYVYGTEPNDHLRATAHLIPEGGEVLCLADGEGRNGVHLARLGYRVTSVDASAVGLAKARALAAAHGVDLSTVHADLAEFDLGTNRWDAIVSVFCHLPPPLRSRIHAEIARALRPGGVYILEAYTPDQLAYRTGGPPVVDLMMSAEILRRELVGLTIDRCGELVREITEGTLHHGRSAVVQCVAHRS